MIVVHGVIDAVVAGESEVERGELEDEELGSVLHELRAVVRRSVIPSPADLTSDLGFCAVTG